MGYDLYEVKLNSTNIPRNYEYQDFLINNFTNDRGNIYIEKALQLDEKLTTKQHIKWEQELKETKKLLKKQEHGLELTIA